MPTLMQNAATWLGAQLQAAAGRAFTYSQAGVDYSITATVGLKEYEVYTEEQSVPEIVPVWEMIITASELAVTPRDGDRMAETLVGVAVVYEVLPVGKKPCVEPLDSSGLLLLVRTKKVG